MAAEPETPTLALESAPQTVWCDHAGVLVLAPILVGVAQVVDPAEPLFKQWLASLLLGALNIEQTKFLNWPENNMVDSLAKVSNQLYHESLDYAKPTEKGTRILQEDDQIEQEKLEMAAQQIDKDDDED